MNLSRSVGTFTGVEGVCYAGIASRDYDLVRAVGASGGARVVALGDGVVRSSSRRSRVFSLRPSRTLRRVRHRVFVLARRGEDGVGRHWSRGFEPGGDGAAVVGVNVLLAPDVSEIFRAAGMLSPSGRCKTLDAARTGTFERRRVAPYLSSLCRATIPFAIANALERVESATIVAGAAVNQDGRSSSLTAPNGPSQTAAIRAAMERR